jgi:hypothetical protein
VCSEVYIRSGKIKKDETGWTHVRHVNAYIQSVSWEPSRGRLLQECRRRRESNNLDIQAYNGESDWVYVIQGRIPW